MYTNLEKANNSKNSKIEKSKPKAQKSKLLNNSSYLDQRENIQTPTKT